MAGMAALSWETIWQIKSSLALGVSAWGTALTLAVTMGGMCLGALIAGHLLRNRAIKYPLIIYGALECTIGISGLFLGAIFSAVENLDIWAYGALPGKAGIVHISGIVTALGIPTLCMGATLPVLGLVAKQFQTSIALLYALNTLGAALGVLLAAFLFIPSLGVSSTAWAIASINFGVAALAWTLRSSSGALNAVSPHKNHQASQQLHITTQALIVSITGFATFMLEVAWFRSLTAAFKSSTEAFAIMLASVLLALGLGAHFAYLLKRKTSIGTVMGWAGILILLATPVIERFDLFMRAVSDIPFFLFLQWFGATFYVIGAPVFLLGIALPWVLDDQRIPSRWGKLYGLNALAAIFGSIGAAWIFLPTIGFARTAWVTGIIVVLTGIAVSPAHRRFSLSLLGAASLLIAVLFESGVGVTRVQGTLGFTDDKPSNVVQSYEGPEATLSVVQYGEDQRLLFIDGFVATEQSHNDSRNFMGHYMAWMGHLPMLLHPDPKNALVICFGTGQTANAVRNEGPQSLMIVDINKNIFKLAHNFSSNQGVLEDPRVKTTVMDGRAYMRRTKEKYDVITLEPMPPTFSGVNALYSREFYQQARERLGPDGIIAQWLPFHLVAPSYSASIAKTFQSVFPNAILWIDPPSSTGILIGSINDTINLAENFPGFSRNVAARDMTEKETKDAVYFNREELARYGTYGAIITDDNQILAYGKAAHLYRQGDVQERNQKNYDLLQTVKNQKPQ